MLHYVRFDFVATLYSGGRGNHDGAESGSLPGVKLRNHFVLRWLLIWSGLFHFGFYTTLARTITLAWHPSIGGEIAGYKILWGVRSGVYTSIQDVGNVTTAAVILPDDIPEFFLALIAYTPDGLQSVPSDELIYRPPMPPRLQLALANQRELTLSWNAISGTGYRVLQKPDLLPGKWQPASKVMIASSSLMEWKTAFDSTASSDFFKLEVIPDPQAPPKLQLALASDQIKLSWASVPGMAYRVLYKPTLAEPSWTPVSGLLNADSTLVEWMTQVTSGAPSGFFVLQVIADPEALPSTQIAFVDKNQIKLSWTSVPTKAYQVFYKADLSDESWVPYSDILVAEAMKMDWTTEIDPESASGFFMVQFAAQI